LTWKRPLALRCLQFFLASESNAPPQFHEYVLFITFSYLFRSSLGDS
jgi:hypothetical protein